MDSFGDRLRESRESQSYTLDHIARDTRISKRYLQALEKEDFSVFPGETYLIGFLRNYTQYLGLDSDEFITLYRNIKIQEQPIPMDELIHGKTKTPPAFLTHNKLPLEFNFATNMSSPPVDIKVTASSSSPKVATP